MGLGRAVCVFRDNPSLMICQTVSEGQNTDTVLAELEQDFEILKPFGEKDERK